MTARNLTPGSPVARVREGTGTWGLPRRPGSRQRGRRAGAGSTDLCWGARLHPLYICESQPVRIAASQDPECKRPLSSAQNRPYSRTVSPTELWDFLFPTPLLSGPLQFFFLLESAAFLLFISWPAPTSGISPNIASSRMPSETGLGAPWCLNSPLQSRPWPSTLLWFPHGTGLSVAPSP